VYEAALRRWYRRAYVEVDAVMSCVQTDDDARRESTLRLRLGLHPAFRPQHGVARGDHVLYVGRLSREKGLRELLDAAAVSQDPWELVLIGTGPAGDMLRERARAAGIEHRVRFEPYVTDRELLDAAAVSQDPWELVLIGTGPAGDMLRERARGAGIEHRVRFEPFVTDRAELARAYAGAACVALPGPHETFGLVALEAAACGASVVTAGETPSAELLGDRVETFRAGDPTELMAAIARARCKPRDQRAARAIAERHGWDAALAAELSDLERLLHRR
jgi:alpha-1,6-mannosyltransferase